jgi:hypothetical protein
MDQAQAAIAHKRNFSPIGRELGIVAGGRIGIASLHAGSVAEVVKPQAAGGVEEQMA